MFLISIISERFPNFKNRKIEERKRFPNFKNRKIEETERFPNFKNRKIEERGQIIEKETESKPINLRPHIIIAASLLVTGILLMIASIIMIIAYCKNKKMKISQTDEESGNRSFSDGTVPNNIRYIIKMFSLK